MRDSYGLLYGCDSMCISNTYQQGTQTDKSLQSRMHRQLRHLNDDKKDFIMVGILLSSKE